MVVVMVGTVAVPTTAEAAPCGGCVEMAGESIPVDGTPEEDGGSGRMSGRSIAPCAFPA